MAGGTSTVNSNLSGNSSDLRLWVVIALSAVISILMFSNYGETLVSNYYANRNRRCVFDEKKLSRVIGIAMAVMTVILLVMKVLGSVISDSYSWIFVVLVLADMFAAIFIAYTKCRKEEE